ncbi:hypothetical protein [Streptomyces sp.]|uniref:hypothetical protein n=1 Tax=Streptomyces sp. TaxID=1931 RepID=UPI002F95BA3D
MSSVHARAYVERAPEQGPIPWVVANEGLMADGIDLKMDALDLGRFEKNPIIGYGHDYFGRESLPIGRAVETVVDGPKLRLMVEFDQGDEFARTVDRKVRGGFLNTMSVGFSVDGLDEHGVPSRWELFESSVVPLPMDPDATAERLARSLSALRTGQLITPGDAAALLTAAGLGRQDAPAPPAPGKGRTADPDEDGQDETGERLARRLRLARARTRLSR